MSGIHSKRYRSLFFGYLFSRVTVIVLALRWFLARNDFDLASFTGHMTGMLLVFGMFAFLEYHTLPGRFWFESNVLCVEHISGGVDRFERWVITKNVGFETLHAQSEQKTLRMPLCGYVKRSQSSEVGTG
jgi:hypothetical protein